MRTFKEYQEKLKKMRKNVYMNGELVERDHPSLVGGRTSSRSPLAPLCPMIRN
jgi:aromatic ring hydroxylase